MNKTMSKFLETRVFGETIRIRTVLTLLLCVVNFALAYGICLYYLMSGGPTLLIISLILTILLVLILAFPNCEAQEDAEAKDVVD